MNIFFIKKNEPLAVLIKFKLLYSYRSGTYYESMPASSFIYYCEEDKGWQIMLTINRLVPSSWLFNA